MVRRLIVAVSALALWAAGARAQQATIRGTVIDQASGEPVPHAEVRLLDARDRRTADVLTGGDGRFVLPRLGAGEYRLRATALGYLETTTPVLNVSKVDTLEVTVRLGVNAVPLAPLEVVARSATLPNNTAVAAFHRRAELQLGGRYVLPEQLAARRPSHTIDLFLEIPSVEVSHTAKRLLNARTLCAPHVYVDGIRMTRGARGASPAEAYEVINAIHPADLHGVEVYTGVSTVPSEFSGTGAGCGIIAIWLRR